MSQSLKGSDNTAQAHIASHANRHAWALGKYRHLLVGAVERDTSAEAREVNRLPKEQIPGRLVSLIMERADPTPNKGMTAWLVQQYAQGGLRLEDLGTANETLAMFQRYAQRLEPGQRDLGQYPRLAAVWEAVIGFAHAEEQILSGKAQKALARDRAYAESRILRQDPDGFTIAVPLTEFAAKWWGKGTRWCTAAEKENQFFEYHDEAPLIVIVVPDLGTKGKFQLWATDEEFQLLNAQDEAVPEELIVTRWDTFEKVYRLILSADGLALMYVPKGLLTEELCRIAVAQNGGAFSMVPHNLRTYEICRLAVAQDGLALRDVLGTGPIGLLSTDEMCRIAVAQNGRALEYVPQKLRTDAICRISVAQNGLALKYVSEDLRTEDLCRIAVARHGRALEHVPEDLRTNEMCRIAVAQNGWTLLCVPKKLRSEDLCRVAVAQNGYALCWVPQKLRTDELCRIAVAQNGGALYDVPENLRTEELCRIAVGSNGLVLECVPEVFRTEEMCKIAVSQNGEALQYVPTSLISKLALHEAGSRRKWDISKLDHMEGLLSERHSKKEQDFQGPDSAEEGGIPSQAF